MFRSLCLAALLVAAGCAAGDQAPEDTAADLESTVRSNESADAAAPDIGVAEVDTTGPAEVTVAGQTVPTRAVVTDVEAGDRACYLTLRTDSGSSTTVFGDFSLCETDGLMGQRIQVEYAPDDILAASCEGDPSCLETETVAMAVAADRIQARPLNTSEAGISSAPADPGSE